MDARRQARGYLARHGIEQWFRAAAERLVVSQPENPMHDLLEALGKEIESREKLKSAGREEGSVSLAARIVVRGRGGVRQEISLDKVANEDMVRGAQGAFMVKEWGSLLGSRVSEALVGGTHGGDTSVGTATEAAGAESKGAGEGDDAKSSDQEGAGGASRQEGDGSGIGHWMLPDDMIVRLKQLFGKIDKDENGVLDAEERDEMREEMRLLLIEFGMGGNVFERLPAGINYAEFEAWFLREWETASKMQALADIDLSRAMAELIPGGSVHHPLGGLERMGATEIRDVSREKLGAAAELALSRKQAQVKDQAERMRARQRREGNEQDEGGGMANSKYAILGEGVRMAKFGSIEDFHTGIGGEIGMPNPNFMEGMEAEHCSRQDSKDEFKPGNYDTTTTPSQEWLVATDEDEAKRVSVGARRVRTLKELMEDSLVKKAKLRDVEVVALVLYTGPMFLKYNGILRRFPDGVVKGLKGNTYTTTIHCIVSGIIKLSKVMRLPDSRTVYRGLGGLDLPEAFTTPDECGIRGGVENGMLSTTLDRKVALQYAGNTMPTVFEISLGAIDRGASLQFLSQYPDEEEILLPPRSYLEIIGGLSRKETDENGRVIKIVSLKVNANMSSSTIEQIEGKRMEIFVSAGANVLDNIKSKMKEVLASDRLKEYLVHHPIEGIAKIPHIVANTIVRECKMWLSNYIGKGSWWFNDEWQYSKAMRELSELERLSTGKMDLYLGGRFEFILFDQPMKEIARMAEADMIRRLDEMVAKSKAEGGTLNADARELALELCRKRGTVIKSINETNELGEPPLVASGARGDVENLGPLLIAGCKLESARKGDGCAALHMACMMGHLEYVRRLADEGADLHQKTADGRTGLILAAQRGQLNVAKLILERGGVQLGMMVSTDGLSSALAAAESGQLGVLQYLNEVCGKELLMQLNKEGESCASVAAMGGHIEIVKYLYGTCGPELLVNTDGKSCAYAASMQGHQDILEYVHEACGREVLMLQNKHGGSCVTAAATGGQMGIIEYLHKACGTEVLMDDGSASLAAFGGHLNVVQYLHQACGTEVLMFVDEKSGMSCALMAAFNGHLKVLEYLHQACGKDLLMIVSKEGISCALVAARRGDLDVIKYLHKVCGQDMLMDKNGVSCALAASGHGRLGVVEYLHKACGTEILMQVDTGGVSCAYAAAQNGRLGVVEYLHKACGAELLMKVTTNGVSCAYIASSKGHVNVLEYLHEVCGNDLLMLMDKNGVSCAYAAASNGHLGVVEYLHKVCGKEQLMLVKKDGTSCALIAAREGHLDVLRWLYEVCGRELLMLVDKDGVSCADVAASNGHSGVVEYLGKVCGKEPVVA